MTAVLSVFKIRFKSGAQYRAAAFAGAATQFFWGFMLIMIYEAFYKNSTGTQPISFSQLVDLTWLQQAFLALIALWVTDREVMSQIESGGIAYELVRPLNLYFLWFAKTIGMRVSNVILRFWPIIAVAFFFPKPYNLSLPASLLAFVLFLFALWCGTMMATIFMLLLYMIGLYTVSILGIVGFASIFAQILAGQYVPIALMPGFLQKAVYLSPFAYVSDFPFRVYSGNIAGRAALTGFCVEIVWIIALFGAGIILLRKGIKRVVSQGG